MSEQLLQRKALALLQSLGAYVFKPVVTNRSGIPDIIVCYRGHFLAYECKLSGNHPTPLQSYNLVQINAAGGVAKTTTEKKYKHIITE